MKAISWEHDEQGREWPAERLDEEQVHTGGPGKELRFHCECRRAWEAVSLLLRVIAWSSSQKHVPDHFLCEHSFLKVENSLS